MNFSRSRSGISNYKLFHRVDAILYTEGKPSRGAPDSEILPDVKFYQSILKTVFPNFRWKVKCVGNKSTAMHYANEIANGKIKNSLVAIDRDFCGITHSMINQNHIIMTHGYSWENDLWTKSACKNLAETIAPESFSKISSSFDNLARRIRKIGILDASLQVAGTCLLKKGKGSFGGLSPTFSSHQPLQYSEVKRILNFYRQIRCKSCELENTIIKMCKNIPFERVVQGHIWSNLVRGLVAWTYRACLKETAPSNKALLNITLAFLSEKPRQVLGGKTLNYYRRKFENAVSTW